MSPTLKRFHDQLVWMYGLEPSYAMKAARWHEGTDPWNLTGLETLVKQSVGLSDFASDTGKPGTLPVPSTSRLASVR